MIRAMFEQRYVSDLLQKAVEAFSRLPGIGPKSALRLALYLLRQEEEESENLAQSIVELRRKVVYCSECRMISDAALCPVCSNPERDRGIICVVENVRDVMSIEHTGRYKGLYHVLGGIISPIEGIGPTDLSIEPLMDRLARGVVREVILALSTTMEGETTCFYLYKKMASLDLNVTTIARGVGFGDQLEYTDELTLGRSIENRLPFKPE
ncbi:MAG TPA: recombination mediator RecR [Bacteroidales bacterium]|jgi:recombination protein RecR|nr:MAG: Recombination protein RecR [Bacteroidetes bacterium ADurb.Bin013]HNR27787.1 recombination mediator RecR [Bacteroidales bacterium]HOT54929.1 recombination mediator RecR [Bacteroidales bacterium]HPH80074.1 recombination mediator RecR [Bacteroidales bacterium]HPM16857.1 recombination mediator RecR [Bacteroidales bacterium]